MDLYFSSSTFLFGKVQKPKKNSELFLNSYEHVYRYYKSDFVQDMHPYEQIVLLNNPLRWITPICLIAQFAPIDTMKTYLQRNLKSHHEVVASNNTTLFHAVCCDYLANAKKRIEILIEDFKFPVDITDEAGRTACFYSNDPCVLNTLIRHYGASLTCRDKDNLLPGCYWVRNVDSDCWQCLQYFVSPNNNEELMDEILKSQNNIFIVYMSNKMTSMTTIQQFEYFIHLGYILGGNYDVLKKAKDIDPELPIEYPVRLLSYVVDYFTLKYGKSCYQIQFILNELIATSHFADAVYVKYIEIMVSDFKTDFKFIDNVMIHMYEMKPYLSSHLDYLEIFIQNYHDLVFVHKLHFIARWIKLCFHENDDLWSRVINFKDYSLNTILYYAAMRAKLISEDEDKEFLVRCLRLKADVNYKNAGCIPLHFYFADKEWILNLLLEQGIHIDAVNRFNKKLTILKPEYQMRSLQCLSACAIKTKNSDLVKKLPNCLINFVSIHKPF